MQVISLSRREFAKLKELELDQNIYNSESKIYVHPVKKNWEKKDQLLKRFYLISGVSFGNKLQTINSLLDVREKCDIEALVFPNALAAIDNELVGYTMDWIKSTNLKTMLDDMSLPIETKIDYLKQIGQLLRDMKNFRTYHKVSDFFLNDMHECNFVVKKEDNKVYAVDLDSMKINGNLTFGSNYLSCYSPAHKVGKYQILEDGRCGGMLLPDENTDLFCYNIIILNFLYYGKVTRLELDEFYEYLEYLKDIGLNKELIDIFDKLYINAPNENPDYLLDSIKEVYPRSLRPVFNHVRG